MQNWWQ